MSRADNDPACFSEPVRVPALVRTLLLSLGFLSVSLVSHAQDAAALKDYPHYLELLVHSKDSLYEQILSRYEAFILREPSNVQVQVARCRFIEGAYYDEYDEYNPKQDELDECIDRLVEKFPDEPSVLVLKSAYLYGDSAVSFLRRVEWKIVKQPRVWQLDAWKIYKELAEHLEESEPVTALEYCELATKSNDTLDLSLLMARLYQQRNQNDEAIKILRDKLRSSKESWVINQKGKLLLELGEPELAIEAFRLAKKDTSSWQDAKSLAKALINSGHPEEAREYLYQAATTQVWSKVTQRELFEYDMTYGSADSAKLNYRKVVDDNFLMDPLGVDRLRLFIRAPASAWKVDDLLRVFLLVVVFAFAVISPYLLILPIHYLGAYFRARGMTLAPSSFRWGLREFWIVISAYLVISVLTEIIFGYDAIVYMVNDIPTEPSAEQGLVLAHFTVAFTMGFMMVAVILLKRTEILECWKKIGVGDLGRGIASAIGLRFALGAYILILKSLGWWEAPSNLKLSISDNIIAVNQHYHPLFGFLLVVVLVPIYEEVIFRGISLSAAEKHMRFWIANSLQAFLFAVVHQELILFPFYFAFGLMAGHFSRKTGSLVTGVAAHVTNNFIAFLGILYLSR